MALVQLRHGYVTGIISRPRVLVGRRSRVGKNHGTDNANGTSAGCVGADRADSVATR